MVEINSFYGNRHTRHTEAKERLKDMVRKAFLKASGIDSADFYTPEIRGNKYLGPGEYETGAFQVVATMNNYRGKPRWDVTLQFKEYPQGTKEPPVLVSERSIAVSVTAKQAFDQALTVFSLVRWNSTGAFSHGEYRYGPDGMNNVKPIPSDDGHSNRAMLPMTWMPVFEALRLRTHRTLERRAMVLNRLNEENNVVMDTATKRDHCSLS